MDFNGYTDFNSHAHVERDFTLAEKSVRFIISTHTLTWSVTPIADCEACEVADFNSHAHVERDRPLRLPIRPKCISTHTLTWSVTLDVVYIWCLLNVMRTYFFI